MSTRPAVARPAPRPQGRDAPRRPARPRTTRRSRRRPGLILVVPLTAALLFGIVFLNVAKLNLTTQTGQIVERSRAVEAETVRLESRLQQENGRVADRAQARLQMEAPTGPVTRLRAAEPR